MPVYYLVTINIIETRQNCLCCAEKRHRFCHNEARCQKMVWKWYWCEFMVSEKNYAQ